MAGPSGSVNQSLTPLEVDEVNHVDATPEVRAYGLAESERIGGGRKTALRFMKKPRLIAELPGYGLPSL